MNENSLNNLKPAQPGEVRNPKGRPKGSQNISTQVKKWLGAKERITNPLTKKASRMSQMDIMILRQIEKARKGDTNAFNALLNRAYGMPTQKLENQQLDEQGEPTVPPKQVMIIGGKEIEF